MIYCRPTYLEVRCLNATKMQSDQLRDTCSTNLIRSLDENVLFHHPENFIT